MEWWTGLTVQYYRRTLPQGCCSSPTTSRRTRWCCAWFLSSTGSLCSCLATCKALCSSSWSPESAPAVSRCPWKPDPRRSCSSRTQGCKSLSSPLGMSQRTLAARCAWQRGDILSYTTSAEQSLALPCKLLIQYYFEYIIACISSTVSIWTLMYTFPSRYLYFTVIMDQFPWCFKHSVLVPRG